MPTARSCAPRVAEAVAAGDGRADKCRSCSSERRAAGAGRTARRLAENAHRKIRRLRSPHRPSPDCERLGCGPDSRRTNQARSASQALPPARSLPARSATRHRTVAGAIAYTQADERGCRHHTHDRSSIRTSVSALQLCDLPVRALAGCTTHRTDRLSGHDHSTSNEKLRKIPRPRSLTNPRGLNNIARFPDHPVRRSFAFTTGSKQDT